MYFENNSESAIIEVIKTICCKYLVNDMTITEGLLKIREWSSNIKKM